MNNKLEVFQRILQLSEYVKISFKDDSMKHHQLKHDLGKSNKRIICLLKRKGSLNQRQMSKELNISPQAISEAVKKLETMNFITKDIVSKNETKIKLSVFGKEHAELIEEMMQKHADTLLDDFNDEEIQLMINFINKIIYKEKKDV